MRIIVFTLVTLFLACKPTNKLTMSVNDSKTEFQPKKYAMVIHGGAGTILKKNMSEADELAYKAALNKALDTGQAILEAGGSSSDAVVATIMIMEDSPLFNAGKGAVFAHSGQNEMDASIMRGTDLEAGAVGGVTHIKNPITAARAVMEKSEHVFMVGEGAEDFSKSQNIEIVDPSYFRTERRWESLQRAINREKASGSNFTELSENKFGTVGAVALDMNGNITAGTSTGGMTNKRYNRIGDSPIIGAGTYANDLTCGVSCTGHGEYFIRYAVAHDVSAMMEYGHKSVEEASDHIINEKLVKAGGSGGLIALDKDGNVAMPFNTAGMYRGYVNDIERYVGIYKP